MRPLVWVMKKKRISTQQTGLSILIVILLLGWGINFLFSFQGDLGPIRRGNEISILITGEIKNPGVYEFDREPSLKELMARAGSLVRLQPSSKADRYCCLTQGTSVQVSSENGYIRVSAGFIPAAYKVTLGIPLSVNTATQKELETIPGLGPYLAKKILDHRSLHGPFNTIEEVKNVTGMGKFRYSKIKPYIKI
jgi:competence protein ComEA